MRQWSNLTISPPSVRLVSGKNSFSVKHFTNFIHIMHFAANFVIMEKEGRISMAKPSMDNYTKTELSGPTPLTKTAEYVRLRFENEEEKIGHTNPQKIAHAIIGEGSTLAPKIAREITRMPTEDFLYDGATKTLESLLISGDKIIIWTQGDTKTQLWKVATSGIGELRKKLKPENRRQISVFSAEDKFTPLPAIFDQLRREGYESVIIVDDKAQNITKSTQMIEDWKKVKENSSMEITPVWINQGRTKDQVPQGFTLETFKRKFTTVENLRELPSLKESSAKKTAWLIDFDHTLLNTAEAKENLFKRIAEILPPTRVVLSPELIHEIGINGKIENAQELKEGMSNGKVIRIDTQNDAVVIKYNPENPIKLIQEVQGYMLLADTPLSPHLLLPRIVNDKTMFIVLPYFDGIQLRAGLRTGLLPQNIALQALNELLDIKKGWWSSQKKGIASNSLSSMQRSEHFDTLSKIILVLPQLSSMFNVPIEDLGNSPIISGATKLPSLFEMINKISEFMKSSPPFTMLAHGDATGGNIIINPSSKKWKIVDAEWAGNSDPAEAFARMAKYISTTTLPSVGKTTLSRETEGIKANLILDIPEASKIMQETALSRIPEFSDQLKDNDFRRRVFMYLTSSYLREMALTLKRGNPELSIFAIIKAGEAMLQSENGH